MSGCLRRCWALLGARTGHIEEPLVLLVGLVEHRGQAGDMFPVVAFAFLGRLELFTQDVHEVAVGGR
jgi:hypothetical protein